MTESATPLNSPNANESATNVNSDTVSSDKGAAKKSTSTKMGTQKPPASTSSNKISKLAMFALLIALAAPAGHYYWQQLQSQQLTQTLTNKISKQNSTVLDRYQSQMQQALTTQQQNFEQQLQQVIAKINNTSQSRITELNASITQLEQRIKQRQPNDWLLHEAEYLIRIASRTLWLEHDTKAAIGLLKDADRRLTELNEPAFLPVRAVLQQDIKSLALMPTLQTDEIILTLMAMSKQVAELPLAIVDLANKNDNEADLTLSDDINDWQSNLAKTWQQFFNDFIRIRPRTGTIEPLISPKQQANLKENLTLKIQLALWAASERKSDIYQKSLTEIQLWINEFFDMKELKNQSIIKTLQDLAQKQVNYDYPNELSALKAIRVATRNGQASPALSSKQKIDNVESKPQDKTVKAIKATSEMPETQQPKQHEQAKSEGSL